MCKPLIIGRDHVPRRMFSGGMRNHVIVSGHVAVPVLAFMDISFRKFPILLGFVKSLKKPGSLLLLRHVQVELANDHAVTGKRTLESVDIFKALLPDAL